MTKRLTDKKNKVEHLRTIGMVEYFYDHGIPLGQKVFNNYQGYINGSLRWSKWHSRIAQDHIIHFVVNNLDYPNYDDIVNNLLAILRSYPHDNLQV